MKTVCFINGSLRGKKASSLEFLKDVDRRLSALRPKPADIARTYITVKAKLETAYPDETLAQVTGADALVLVFPLYSYGLPGALMRLLEDYYRYIRNGHYQNHEVQVYAVINCAYPRPEICEEAVRVIRNYCRRLSLDWRFAVCIGTGPVVVLTKKLPLLYPNLKKAFAEIACDIRNKSHKPQVNYFIHPVIPESIIAMIKRQYEKKGQMYAMK